MSILIGNNWIELETVNSTNQYALDLITKTAPIDGTVILAHQQTAGRGQMGSRWETNPFENITMSIILKPTFLAASEQFYLNQAVCLGVYEALKIYLPALSAAHLKIKWSNDIYVYDKKLGGILIENSLQGNFICHSVIGIGINVNQTTFPPDLPNPVSLSVLAEKKFDSVKIAKEIGDCIERFYFQLKFKQYNNLQSNYEKLLYRKDEYHPFKTPNGEIFWGKILGVATHGALRLETADGEKRFLFKEIIFC